MIKEIREKYISLFDDKTYEIFIQKINLETNNRLDFRISETPLFIDENLRDKLIFAGEDILKQIQKSEFLEKSKNAVPEKYFVPNEDDHPIFLQIDFGITKNSNGDFIPQLIELQGFPSLYAYQIFLDQKLREHFYIPKNFTTYYNSFDFNSYVDLLKKTLIGNSNPENVILLEIEPDKQKTRIDFYLTEKYADVESVCITEIIKKKRKLYYKKKGFEIPIERIYNRVIFDELEKKNLTFNFDFRDELNLNWVGHPNWFYRISKFSLPEIKSEFSPQSYYLNELETYPSDLENYVLKPLFSFAGSGVVIDLTKEILDSINDKQNYILQKKVDYFPLIKTPEGNAKAEIRMMYIWNENPILVNNLLRTSKGKMMGVDFNKNQTWIGSNTVYHPQ
ncbi:MAG: hypothetical protein IPM32_13655 [Ignavibacteriae bacterium]|nr:hypothetical protein [Ignavibacteriota bacterium]